MGKRSLFNRVDKDQYDTPFTAVEPLLDHLDFETYAEPCAGKGNLVDHLSPYLSCVWKSDIAPRRDDIFRLDANRFACPFSADAIITNPPWSRNILHPLISHFALMRPTWLLIDSNWANTKQAASFLKFCAKIVTIGRVVWIPGTRMSGKDDCAWYLFDRHHEGPTHFYGRDHGRENVCRENCSA